MTAAVRPTSVQRSGGKGSLVATKRMVLAGLVGVAWVSGSAGWPGEAVAAQDGLQWEAGKRADASHPVVAALRIDRDAWARYADLMGLNADQHDAAMDLHAAYVSGYDRLATRVLDSSRPIEPTVGDPGPFCPGTDWALFWTDRAALRFVVDAIELGDAYMDRLRTLAGEDAARADLQRVEDARARETFLAISSIADAFGAAADLIAIGREFDPPHTPAEDGGRVASVLAKYERDVGRFSQRRIQELVENARLRLEPPEPGAADDRADFMLRLRMDGHFSWLERANVSGALDVLRALPEPQRVEWDAAFKRARWPGVYGPNRLFRTHDAALELGELTSDQRAAIAEVMAEYAGEAARVNLLWTHEWRTLHSMRQSVCMGFSPADAQAESDHVRAVEDARTARLEIDERFAQRVLAILTRSQREAVRPAAIGDPGDGGG